MYAVRIHEHGGPEVLRYEEVPTPTPGEGQALVRLVACGVIEMVIRSGAISTERTSPSDTCERNAE